MSTPRTSAPPSPRTPMTVAALRRRLQKGVVIRCVYRWWWETKPHDGPETLRVERLQTRSVAFTRLDNPGKPLSWLYFPTVHNSFTLYATPNGFELEVPGGGVNRYEWVEGEAQP